MSFYGQNMRWWYGFVVDTDGSGGVGADPLRLGRALVRILDIHGEDVEDNELPWASVIVPTTEGGINGIGTNPLLKPGARVVGFFLDGERSQNPVIFGSIPTIEGEIRSSNPGTGGLAGNPAAGGTTFAPNNNVTDSSTSPGYPAGLSMGEVETWVREEAKARGIDPDVAVAIFNAEGRGGYQSSVRPTNPKVKTLNGREASFGPFQLYTGGGLGKTYEQKTGRNLITDNTREGIRNQIKFALDEATGSAGWQPWYGRGPAGVGQFQGLAGSKRLNDWK